MRVTTEKQRQASRENGKKSRGPKSGRSRRSTALSRLQQALCARAVVLDNESRENFTAVLRALCHQFEPDSPVENALIEEMAASFWRLRRIWAIETAVLNQSLPNPNQDPASNLSPADILADFRAQIERTRSSYAKMADGPLRSLRLDEGRLHRAFNRALRALDYHRVEKQKLQPKPGADQQNQSDSGGNEQK